MWGQECKVSLAWHLKIDPVHRSLLKPQSSTGHSHSRERVLSDISNENQFKHEPQNTIELS